MRNEDTSSFKTSSLPVERKLLHPRFEGYKLARQSLVKCQREYDLSDCLSDFHIANNASEPWYQLNDGQRVGYTTSSTLEEVWYLSRLNHLFAEEETLETHLRHFWFFAQRHCLVSAIINVNNLDELQFQEIQLPSSAWDESQSVYPPSGCLLSPCEMLVSNGLGSLTRVSRDTLEGVSVHWEIENFLNGKTFVILDGIPSLMDRTICYVALGRFLDREIRSGSISRSAHIPNTFNIDLFEISSDGRGNLIRTIESRHPPDLVRFHIDDHKTPCLLVASKDTCFVDQEIEKQEFTISSRPEPSTREASLKDKTLEPKSINQTGCAYSWSQTYEDITINIPWIEEFQASDVCILMLPNAISLGISGSAVWQHRLLYDHIVVDESTWTVDESHRSLSLSLAKHAHLRWPHLLEYDDGIKETEIFTDSWTANPFVTDPFDRAEEIDYHEEQATYLHVIDLHGTIHAKHKYISTELICRSFTPSHDTSLLLGFQFDIDAALMTYHVSSDLKDIVLRHQSTLCAFAYVQTSKKDRKFSYSTLDARYAFISEYQGNVFLYRQPDVSKINSNDSSEKKYPTYTAAQEIITSKYPKAEILGIQSLDGKLCVLLTSISILFFQLL
jgi:hypothetical protein